MIVQVSSNHRKAFNMSGQYCASQVLNCIMTVYDIATTELHRYTMEFINEEGVVNLLELPAGKTLSGERTVVRVTYKQ